MLIAEASDLKARLATSEANYANLFHLWQAKVDAALAEERALGDRLAACMEIRWGAPPNDDLYAVVVTADAPDALDAHRAARAALATGEKS